MIFDINNNTPKISPAVESLFTDEGPYRFIYETEVMYGKIMNEGLLIIQGAL